MRHELSKEDIYFLARVKKIEVEHLLRMQDLLDPKKVRGVLIRYEFKERARGNKIAKRDIIDMLMYRYNVSRSYIEAIVYEKRNRMNRKECLNCGSKVSTYRWNKNDGFCNACVNNNTIDNNGYE